MTAMAGSTELRSGGASDTGRVRTNNQDSFLTRDDIGLWVVADGMGGHRGGEVASQIVCETIDRSFARHTIDGLVEAIEGANAAVYQAGSGDPDLSGMGTTIVALALVDDGEGDEVLAIANVGDSRAYRLSGNELEQLTNDHSLVADLVREGSLSPEEAMAARAASSTTSTTTTVTLSRPPPSLARRTSSLAASVGSASRRRTAAMPDSGTSLNRPSEHST